MIISIISLMLEAMFAEERETRGRGDEGEGDKRQTPYRGLPNLAVGIPFVSSLHHVSVTLYSATSAEACTRDIFWVITRTGL
jgi:hypothetical protein